MMLTKAILSGREDVSRETLANLENFVTLLRRWNGAINLISRSTVPDIWTRHVLDSVQVFDLACPNADRWLDIGSGGGFPGMVVAILAGGSRPGMKVMLVESDTRKATFLRTVSRELGLKIEILTDRVENLPPMDCNIVSARACADLARLLEMTHRHLRADGKALFPKGANIQEEVKSAEKCWRFEYKMHPSRIDDFGVVLEIGDIARV